jgi:DNA polymerase III subunit beta
MKAIINIQTFKEHTAQAGRAISPKVTNPILSNLKLVADRTGKISLTGMDAINTITTSFEAEVIETGTVLLNASKLNNLLERLGNGELTITKIERETEVIIHTQEYGTFELPTTTEEYPESTDRKGEECFTVDSEQLSLAVKKTLYAASSDEYKQVLTGVRFSLGEVLELAATDGHKLALARATIKMNDTLRNVD